MIASAEDGHEVRLLALMLALPVCGTTALAADLAAPAATYVVPVAETPFTWAGAYFGAAIGYGWGSTSHDYIGGPGGGAPSGNSDPDGVLGGVFAGYNFQWNGVVVGFEGDIEAADLSGSYTDKSGLTSAGSADMTWDASIRARLGAAFGRSLLYTTGGIAFAGYEFEGGPLPSPSVAAIRHAHRLDRRRRLGLCGAALDHPIEYRYTRLRQHVRETEADLPDHQDEDGEHDQRRPPRHRLQVLSGSRHALQADSGAIAAQRLTLRGFRASSI
jgi:hypothetical protein